MKTAIITGVTGQDGSTLADFLLRKGYMVYGIVRRVSTPNYVNIQHLLDFDPYSFNREKQWGINFHLVDGDITDLSSLTRIFKEIEPNEIYNLAAQSMVGLSWNQPILTCDVTGMGAVNVFEAARLVCPKARIYQASSSEMFSGSEAYQDENTPFKPRSPYGVAKLFAHHMARIYRESYGMFISCGILFNHEGPRRGIEFVTQKIVDTAVRQKLGSFETLKLGNLDTYRDWSHAEDMVEGMYLMLQHHTPEDFILSSGETHSVYEFVNAVYTELEMPLFWSKNAEGFQHAINPGTSAGLPCQVVVQSVSEFYRPNEVNVLCGKSERAKYVLDWKPRYDFSDLVKDMVQHRIQLLTKNVDNKSNTTDNKEVS